MPSLTAAVSSLRSTVQIPSAITYAGTLQKRFPLVSCGMHRKMKQLTLRVSRFFMLIDFVCEFHLKVQSCPADRPFNFPVKLLPVTLKLPHFKALCGPCYTAELAPRFPEKIDQPALGSIIQIIDKSPEEDRVKDRIKCHATSFFTPVLSRMMTIR